MFENNENLVTEEVAENTEQTAEQTQQEEKRYSQAEVDAIVGKAKARAKANAERAAERKYGRLGDVVKAGLETEDLDQATDTLEKFYASKGKVIQKPQYSAKDIETLARADANEFINAGFEDVVDEVDRLAEIGIENMTPMEKAKFKVLAEHRQSAERAQELEKIGVDKSVLESPEFKEFQRMFREDTPISKVYEQYQKTQPKKEFKTMGSMKQPQGNVEKDYYTPEEISRLTEEDLKDPKVWATVRRSMTNQKA